MMTVVVVVINSGMSELGMNLRAESSFLKSDI